MRNKRRLTLAAAASGLLLLLAFGCSTDSPTAPTQDPVPPSGGTASAAWQITVSLSPKELTAGTNQPTTVTIRVVRADNNQPPATGTTLVASTSLGEFLSPASGVQSIALSTVGGVTSVLLFPGDVVGTAFVVAQLEASVGRGAVPVLEEIVPVEASFTTQNSENNLSIQFLNTSEGSPTKFRWEFGDGATSTEENPHHLYDLPGDYPVKLTASKPGSEDSFSEIVSVSDDLIASFEETIEDLTVVFRDTSEGNPSSWRWDFGDGQKSSEQNPTHTYRHEGSYVVTLAARKSGRISEFSKTVTVGETELGADFEVSIAGRTAKFSDTSSGEPSSWRWDFGDGRTSTAQNPSNTYKFDGEYVVTLEISRSGSSSQASKVISIGGDLFISGLEPDIGVAGTVVTISGTGFGTLRRVFFDDVPADILSNSDSKIVVVAPVPKKETVTEDCDDNMDDIDGYRYIDVYVAVKVELVSGGTDTLTNGFAYDFADNSTCFDD